MYVIRLHVLGSCLYLGVCLGHTWVQVCGLQATCPAGKNIREKWRMSSAPAPSLSLFTHKQASARASRCFPTESPTQFRADGNLFLVLISKGVLKNISVQRSSLSKEDLWISFDWCLCSLFPVIQVNVFETWNVVS